MSTKVDQSEATSASSRNTLDIARRLEFMQLSAESSASIRSLRAFLERELPNGLDKFYAQLRESPEVNTFFSSEKHISQAKTAQIGHWANIMDGNFNDDYVGKVRTIGTVHARIGLEPRWYIGGYALVVEHLVQSAVIEAFPKARLFSSRNNASEGFAKAIASLVKAVLLDMELAISVYLEEAEIAKQAAQAAAIEEERSLVSRVFGQALGALANRDVGYRISEDLPSAYHALRDDFNRSAQQLSDTLAEITAVTSGIKSASDEIRSAATDLSRRTEQQAASIEETAAALEQITTTVSDSSQQSQQAGALVRRTKDHAERSGNVVREAVGAMDNIASSAKEISNIIGVIDEIAFQTNLLALNAGVEAARAGEAGKGFAVVAQEVRELAQRSAKAAKEIKGLIGTSDTHVKSGVALVRETGKALADIVDQVIQVNTNVSAIAESSREQAISLSEINTAVITMDQGTQQNAAMVEQATATAHGLAQEAEKLFDLVSVFRLSAQAIGNTHRPALANGNMRATASPARKMIERVASAQRGNVAVQEKSWQDF